MKTVFLPFCLYFIISLACPVFDVRSQEMQANATGTTAQEKPTQVPLPELPPTPRSKLEIIQYILLPFAIGASVWLILRLEKMEREETQGKEKR